MGSSPIWVVRLFDTILTKYFSWNGVLAQLGEHLPYKQRVIGSSPIGPINYADVAQLAEQLICNQQVTGSSPVVGFLGGFPSGQRGQTVNLLATLSKVRILLRPLRLSGSKMTIKSFKLSRGRAVRQLVGLITRRS